MCTCECVCVCMRVCICVVSCARVCVCACVQRPEADVSHIFCPLHSAYWCSLVGWPISSRDSLISSPHMSPAPLRPWKLQTRTITFSFYMAAGNLNSSSHAYMASTLATEPSPQAQM